VFVFQLNCVIGLQEICCEGSVDDAPPLELGELPPPEEAIGECGVVL